MRDYWTCSYVYHFNSPKTHTTAADIAKSYSLVIIATRPSPKCIIIDFTTAIWSHYKRRSQLLPFIWMSMLFLYGHCKYFNALSAGIDFKCNFKCNGHPNLLYFFYIQIQYD